MTLIAPDGFYELAETYSININKSVFPVNTMRLFYLMLVRDLTHGNDEAIQKTNQLVPKCSGYIDVYESLEREGVRDPKKRATTLDVPRNAILGVIDTPALREQIENTWETERFPQRDQRLTEFEANPPVSLQEQFWSLLAIRCEDRFVYSGPLAAIVLKYRHREIDARQFNPLQDTPETIDEAIGLMMQLNDIADAICYAKDDFRSGSAPLINLVRKHFDSQGQVVGFFQEANQVLRGKVQRLPFSDPAGSHVHQYALLLEGVLEGRRPTG